MYGMRKIRYRVHSEGYTSWKRGERPAIFQKRDIVKSIELSISQANGELIFDTEKFSSLVFPTPHNMIFISHLSKEVNVAKGVARILEYTLSHIHPVRCFIDSEYWGNAYLALDKLQNKYAVENGHYVRLKCNDIAKNVFAMLSMALQKAIKESMLFLFVPPTGQNTTIDMKTLPIESPWIAQELLTSSLIPEYEPLRKLACENFSAAANVHFTYEAPIEHLSEATVLGLIEQLNQ